MKLILGILFALAITHANPLPACGAQFDYNCASATLGGYTVITPLSSTGSTEITGFNSSNAVVFDQTIPAPPTGAPGVAVGEAVLQADAQLAIQSGQASSLPACTPSSTDLCISPSPGTAVVLTSSQTYSYVAQDTPATQSVNQYSTTLIAKLNGSQIFSETLGAQFSDPSFQTAILSANALLTGDGASFDAPAITSGSTSTTGSQISYVQTGMQATGVTEPATTNTFGPAALVGCVDGTTCASFEGVLELPELVLALQGELIVNDNTDIQFAIDRTVTTTNTFLTTQTYEIDGTTSTSAVPEPATWGLMLAGAFAMAIKKTRSSR